MSSPVNAANPARASTHAMPGLRQMAPCLLALLFACASPALQARPLTIGQSAEPSSMDPLFARTGNNQAAAENVFERLVFTDPNLHLQPSLALSWKILNPDVWEIKLRPDVKFHDGSPFTAADVVFSMNRAGNVPNSPAPFSGAVRNIDKLEIVDALTLRIRTKVPSPELMDQIGLVYIVSKRAAEGKKSEDFNSGVAAIGTGRFKLKRWSPGESLELERFAGYWGKPSDFERVTIRYISNDAARMSALLSGSVDVIDSVPPTDIPKLKRTPEVSLFASPSARLIYLALDSSRDNSPFVTDMAGKPLKVNPLKDLRVRQAISKLMMRDAITKRLLSGAGVPAGQMVPEGMTGYTPKLPAPDYAPKEAKALLAEAGYPQGFGLTIHSSNDRFANDSDLAQAVGQLLSRGGLKINGVVTQPYNVYAGMSGKQAYSAFIFTYGNTTSDSSTGLTNVMATYDKAAGTGAFNRARYSNPELDRLLVQAASEFDVDKRTELLQQAAEAGFNDVGVVPLYFPVVYWATRNGIAFRANKAERTSTLYVEEKK